MDPGLFFLAGVFGLWGLARLWALGPAWNHEKGSLFQEPGELAGRA